MKLARWALALGGLLPWLRALGSRELPVSLKLAIDQAFSALCHHLPERTLVLGGGAMCVCSRCAGLYAGIAIAALLPLPLRVPLAPIRRALEGSS
jgi:hypothetical protein